MEIRERLSGRCADRRIVQTSQGSRQEGISKNSPPISEGGNGKKESALSAAIDSNLGDLDSAHLGQSGTISDQVE